MRDCENERKRLFLNYESPALTAELQAHHALTREHPTFNVQRPIFDWSRVLRRNFGLPKSVSLRELAVPSKGDLGLRSGTNEGKPLQHVTIVDL